MGIEAKKMSKDLVEKLKSHIHSSKVELDYIGYSESVFRRDREEKINVLSQLIEDNEIENAFKIFTSNDWNKINEYLVNDFVKLPVRAQKIIFHNTTNLSINGKSVYENIAVSMDGLLSHGNPLVDVWAMFKEIPNEVGDEQATKSLENLFKLRFWPKAVSDLFPTYANLKTKEYQSSSEHFFDDIAKLTEINLGSGSDYFTRSCYNRLVDAYFTAQKANSDEVLYSTEKLRQYYGKLEETSRKNPSFKKSGLLNDISIYTNFLKGKSSYANFLELISHPDIKTKFYDSKNDTGASVFVQMLRNFSEKEALAALSEFVSDPLFDPNGKGSSQLYDYLKNVKDKTLLIDFDLTMPIYEKIVKSEYPLSLCFANRIISNGFIQSFKEWEDTFFGIHRHKGDERIDKTTKQKIQSVVKDYYSCGLIDGTTFEEVFKIVQKTNKNMTLERMKEIVSQNKNIRMVLEYISVSSRDVFVTAEQAKIYPQECFSPYTRVLYEFAVLFPKTRFQEFPDVVVFKSMSLRQKENFNVKVWKQFANLPVFKHDINSRRALVDIIGIMGLFENDPNVEKRRQVAFKLLSDNGDRLTLQEVLENKISIRIHKALHKESNLLDELKGREASREEVEEAFIKMYLSPCKIKKFSLRDGVIIPQELQGTFGDKKEISERMLTELKRTTGSFGKKLGDFLSPFAKDGNVYRLKKDVVVPEEIAGLIGEEISSEEYQEILRLAQLDDKQLLDLTSHNTSSISIDKITKVKQIANFLNPVKEELVDGYMPREDFSPEEREKVLEIIFGLGLDGRIHVASLHRMFDGLNQEFNEEFYDLIVKNWGLILDSKIYQRNIKNVQKSFEQAKRYYAVHGNSNPTFLDIITYFDKVPFIFDFGLDEFAQEVKNSGVNTQETYDLYQALLPKLKSRKLTTIPRHNKTYIYTDKNGKQYKVMTKILRLDDPVTMLVGESKFTNCCQVYHNAGEECMEHASTSQDGGIFAVYLINDEGTPEMLTQSWIWTRESKLCLDNVEATELITGKKGDEKRLYQDIATFGIVEASKDLIESSKEGVESYIAEEIEKINRSTSLSSQQKKSQLKALEELRQRQTLKIVTVGEGCDDLNVAETFREREKAELSQGPKHYNGYRDSDLLYTGESKQHIIIKSSDEILPVDENYQDVALYRDERQIVMKKGENIPHSLLKHITEIEQTAHKEIMVNYSEDGTPTLIDVISLANIYDCDVDDLVILAGEDWYYIYSDNGTEIEVYDFAKKEPRLEDELHNQQEEMNLAFNTILAQSVVTRDGKLERVKLVKADLREDTSYLLYLFQKHQGLVKQDGDDLRYKYDDSEVKKVVTESEQKETIKNIRKIRASGNKDIYMHKVVFSATEKTIEKAINRSLAMLDERSL